MPEGMREQIEERIRKIKRRDALRNWFSEMQNINLEEAINAILTNKRAIEFIDRKIRAGKRLGLSSRDIPKLIEILEDIDNKEVKKIIWRLKHG